MGLMKKNGFLGWRGLTERGIIIDTEEGIDKEDMIYRVGWRLLEKGIGMHDREGSVGRVG